VFVVVQCRGFAQDVRGEDDALTAKAGESYFDT
jgi:hypothetical protein